MKLAVTTLDAKKSGDAELPAAVFGLEVRGDVLHRVVQWQRAKAQAGTHKTKTISEISGTTAKPFKQKGTGRARQGSRRATQFVGGQTVFGPVVRSHAHSLTKKFRVLGLKTALSAKQADASLVILKDTVVASSKTADLVKKITVLGWKNPLIVDVTPDANFVQAACNIKHLDVLPVVGINVWDILRHNELVLTEAALASLQERLS
jgi:large subunit ribosomal protein L4